jgi:hypothetical protein
MNRRARHGRRSVAVVVAAAAVIGAAGIVMARLAFANTATTYSVWDDSAVPRTAADQDSAPVELGMKFRAGQDGVITGVRFYKSPANTGVHTGSLWTATGTRLAGLTFSKESASGWQQAYFQQPVRVSAHTLYVVAYHTDRPLRR